jgi:type II secretory pathway pseudopilin PulG
MSPPAAGKAGFSLMESLIALTLFLFLFLAGIEIFGSVRKTLAKLEEAQMIEENISAAIDRIRADVRNAGRGLAGPPGAEIAKSLEAAGKTLVIRSGEISTRLAADAAAGQSFLPVADGRDFPAGRVICIMDESKGETAMIAETGTSGLSLASPLASAYARAGTSVVLVREISLYMDAARRVLRRKADAGTGQPLLENARSFAFSIGPPFPVVVIAVSSQMGKGEIHEISVHARNAALAVHR